MDKYVENLTERQAEVEINAENNSAETRSMYDILLQDVDKRSEVIFDSFVRSYMNDLLSELSPESALESTKRMADLMDMTFDELNAVPLIGRSDLWRVASSAMVTAASKQAQIMSGSVGQSIVNGINNAEDLKEAVSKMTVEELQAVQVDIKGILKKKKDDKRTT